MDKDGRAYVQDVSEGDLWFFPAGQPHSLQGVGPQGCEFIIVFDDGTTGGSWTSCHGGAPAYLTYLIPLVELCGAPQAVQNALPGFNCAPHLLQTAEVTKGD